jgi:hypothetical protein
MKPQERQTLPIGVIVTVKEVSSYNQSDSRDSSTSAIIKRELVNGLIVIQ